jgi:hypothetical protein
MPTHLKPGETFTGVKVMLPTYKCWIDGSKEATVQIINAVSSFQARQRIATMYGMKTYQVIAIRTDLLKQGE